MDTRNDRPTNRTTDSTNRPSVRSANRPTARSSRPTARTSRTTDRTTDRAARTSRPTARTAQQRRSSSRSSYDTRPSGWQKVMDVLPENVWVNRAIVVVIVLVLIFILFNLVTCIGGALAPKSDDTQANSAAATSASTESASTAAASDAATATASTDGVESPWTDDGKFSTGDSALDNYVKQLCDEHTSQGATFDQAAYDTYLYVSQTDYVERENNQSPWGETWDVEYAKQYFDEGNKGNCYNFAAVTEYVLKYFGYSDAEAEPCIVKLESGAWGDHGLVFVTNKVDGNRCIVDDALSANGWMLGINDYEYDVRNIAQNSTIKGNVDALDDDDNPTPIPPGELTEQSSDTDENTDEEE